MKALFISTLILILSATGHAQQPDQNIAKGFVFHDTNENGIMEKTERGIPEVVVSNGVDIVLTNENGAYNIPVSNDATIFIVKPRDWMTPVNDDNLPQFYYLHKPNGYPENFTYKGVEPTGDLPEEINFPLYPEKSSENYKMVVFGDPQPYSIEMIDFLADDIISELIGKHELKFGVTMGDIVGDNLTFFSPLNQAVAKLGIPWYNVLGNHDINYMAPTDELSDETFESVYGPATYAFVYGDVHFIVVDNVIHESVVGSRKYVGGLRPDQFEFVSNYLQMVPKNHLVVLNMHIPLVEHGESFRQSDQKKLFDLLKDFTHTLSISAHTHVHHHKFFHQDSTDWQQSKPHHHFNVVTTSGSWWKGMRNEVDIPHTMMRDGTPNGYAFISFNGTDYIIDWKVAGSPANHQMNIHLPRGIVANSTETVLLNVNFFNGSEQSELAYRIKGISEWTPMNKVEKFDPYYVKINQRWKQFAEIDLARTWKDHFDDDIVLPGTPMPAPRPSTHLWEANIGSNLTAGRHIIEVRAKDRYGRVFTDYATLRVVKK